MLLNALCIVARPPRSSCKAFGALELRWLWQHGGLYRENLNKHRSRGGLGNREAAEFDAFVPLSRIRMKHLKSHLAL